MSAVAGRSSVRLPAAAQAVAPSARAARLAIERWPRRALRLAMATVGGWVVVNAGFAAIGAVLVAFGLARGEAVMAGALVAFPLYVSIALHLVATRTPLRAALGWGAFGVAAAGLAFALAS